MTGDWRDLIGQRVDIAPLGVVRHWTGDHWRDIGEQDLKPVREGDACYWTPVADAGGGSHLGIEWEESRIVSEVVVRYRSAGTVPAPDQVVLEYWQHTWPAPEAGGWTAQDDPYNGHWVAVNGDVEIEGTRWRYTFDPLDIVEIRGAGNFSVRHRRALKFRLRFRGDARPQIADAEIYSEARWSLSEVDLELAPSDREWNGRFEVYNGCVVAAQGRSDGVVASEQGFQAPASDQPRRLRLSVLRTDAGITSADRTIVTVRSTMGGGSHTRSFSFLMCDLDREPIYAPDLGVFICLGSQVMTCEQFLAAGGVKAGQSIYDRVTGEPEQSYERASAEIPQLVRSKQPQYVVLGAEANRQEFGLRWNGNVFIDKRALKPKGRDTARLLWPGPAIAYRFGTGDPPDWRERETGDIQSLRDGCLPVVTTRCLDREVEWDQEAFAALWHQSLADEPSKRGDEDAILFVRVVARNTTDEPRTAALWFEVSPYEALTVDGGLVMATAEVVSDATVTPGVRVDAYEAPRLRALIEADEGIQVEPAQSAPPERLCEAPTAVRCALALGPRESRAIIFKIPFVTIIDSSGMESLRGVGYGDKLRDTIAYWRGEIEQQMRLDLPDRVLTDFYRAVMPHIAITVDKDVGTGYYMVPAGTFNYDVYGNESCEQIRQFDFRGDHRRAADYLEPFLALQGSRPLHGRYRTQEGVLHGLRVSEGVDYQCGDYNLDHGWLLWQAAEHYLLSRDRDWLERWAPNLIAACDFITREREATKRTKADGGKVWEYGLVPPGHLDDNTEFLYWYAINAYCYRGMRDTAECLRDIGHADAGRIAADAESYRADLLRAIEESITLSPLVRLRDGTWVPHVPVRARLRGRDVGWIREALYGPVLLIECDLIPYDSEMATWVLQDIEDNVFVRREWGRAIDLDRFWFSQGGITIQANLLPNPIQYLRRGQVEHALRGVYNAMAAHLYRGVRCFAEHPIREYGWGAGPFYKTPDEAAFLNWVRMLLVREDGDRLILASGTPRRWLRDGERIAVEGAATYFGPVSYGIESQAGDGVIAATVNPPRRNPPSVLEVHLRHPDRRPIGQVRVNGQPYSDFDAEAGIIRLTDSSRDHRIEARY